MKKIYFLPLLFIFLFIAEANAQTVSRLVATSPFQDSLWVIDTTNLTILRRLGPTPSSGGSLTGTNAITSAPNGTIWAMSKQSAVSGRVLSKVDLLTGVFTIVGNAGDNFSSMTFSSDGKLFAATGDGATTSETLYQIDTITAAKRLVKTMGNGADGEIICYNSTDNMLYHWSGNGTVVFEKMDTVTGPYNFTNIPIIGSTNGETFGAVYLGNNKFLCSNISSSFNNWTSSGTVSGSMGSMPDDLRGLAFVTRSRAINGNDSYCIGDSTLLTSAANTSTIYKWYINGVPISGATLSTYYATSPGHYTCLVNDECGQDTLSSINVSVNPLPTVNLGTDVVVCQGSAAMFDAGNAGSTFMWSNAATTQMIMPTSTGPYDVAVTDANTCVGRDTVMLTVNPLPTVALGVDQAVCNGNTTTFDAGNTGSSFLWNDGTTTQTLMTGTAGTYSVVVTDGNGCMNADTVMLSVNPLPLVDLGGDTAVCAGNTVTLDAANAGSTYSWNDSSTNQTLIASVSGGYSVTVTDANGCMGTDAVIVTVNALPSVSVVATSSVVCVDDASVALTGSPNGGIYSGTALTGNMFDPGAAGLGNYNFTYTYTDVNGCTDSSFAVIAVNACTGIAEHSNAIEFAMLPNPANDQVNFTLGTESVVNIYDATGALVFNAQLSEGTHTVATSSFANGVYFVRSVNKNAVHTQRLVIQH